VWAREKDLRLFKRRLRLATSTSACVVFEHLITAGEIGCGDNGGDDNDVTDPDELE